MADLVSLSLQSLDLRNKEGWEEGGDKEKRERELATAHVTQIPLQVQQQCWPKRKLSLTVGDRPRLRKLVKVFRL